MTPGAGGSARLPAASARWTLPPAPVVMGVLNVTPDSFSDGGLHVEPRRALARAREMVAAGASIIDVGGESTRPGAAPVAVEEELRRVVPVVAAMRRELEVPISVDTSEPRVMLEAVAAGADLVNDVRALARDGALETAAGLDVPVCVMHMQGDPATMQREPHYEDVVAEVREFLASRVEHCVEAGIRREHLIVDPGFGFGKTLEHNIELLRGLGEIASIGLPVMVGLSRKSMAGALTGRPPAERATASAVLAVLAVERGAHVVRVHDVEATVDALAVWARVNEFEGGAQRGH